MPTYRYRCGTCGDEFEQWQSITDAALATHDGCGGALAKVLSPAGIVLKGSGFYKTDSRNGGRRSTKSGDTPSSKDGDAKRSTASEPKPSSSTGGSTDTSTSTTSSSGATSSSSSGSSD